MKQTMREIKKRYFDRAYAAAPVVKCACGCGRDTKAKDQYGRDRAYVNGHNNRKYDNPTQYKREWNHRHRSERQAARRNWIHKFKKELIIAAGGRCRLCGLGFDGECSSIFDFHHRQSGTRDFGVNNASLTKYGKDRIRTEAAKCDLLCANCHRLIHWDWKEGK